MGLCPYKIFKIINPPGDLKGNWKENRCEKIEIKHIKEMHLKFINIFTPDLTRPKHATLRYLINIFQIISNDICFLIVEPNGQTWHRIEIKSWGSVQSLLVTAQVMAIPEEINPSSWKDYLEPDLLSQRHRKAWTDLIQPVLLHSNNIHHSHRSTLPARWRENL